MASPALDGSAAFPATHTSERVRSDGLARLWSLLFGRVDIAGIAFFRIVFGAIMVWEVWRYATLGWITRYYVEPAFHFTYIGFDWVRPLPGVGMYVLFGALALLGLGIAVGFSYRLCTALFFVGYTYVFFLEQATFNNHYYLIALLSFLLILVSAHRALSVDAWRRPGLRSQTAPGWALWALRGMVAIPFLYGALAKLKPDWLQGEPMGLWLSESTDFPLLGRWFTEPWAPSLFSWGGLLFDLLIIPALLWPRTRPLAFVAALGFHVTNAWLFPIGVFPALMIAATTIFLPPSWPREAGLWPSAGAGAGAGTGTGPALQTGPPRPAITKLTVGQQSIVALLGVFFAVQLLLPLRHFTIPGPVRWTEEGFRFAWHMRLRDKWGVARFNVSDPVSGQTWVVDPDEELASFQAGEMASKPDMILQYAHHLAQRWRAGGYEQVEVRADVVASLNGRPPETLVDPTVDLAAQPRTLGPVPWLEPQLEPLRS